MAIVKCGMNETMHHPDEADSMTKDVQSALRQTMEVYTKVTRFCLIATMILFLIFILQK